MASFGREHNDVAAAACPSEDFCKCFVLFRATNQRYKQWFIVIIAMHLKIVQPKRDYFHFASCHEFNAVVIASRASTVCDKVIIHLFCD